MIAIKLCQAHRRRALNYAERHTFIAQRNDLHDRVRAEPHEVARINLNLNPRVGCAGRYRVAFDERRVEPRALPISVAVALEIYLARNQADAHNPRRDVVFIRVVSVIVRGPGNKSGG